VTNGAPRDSDGEPEIVDDEVLYRRVHPKQLVDRDGSTGVSSGAWDDPVDEPSVYLKSALALSR
jgi:hypothetical protein